MLFRRTGRRRQTGTPGPGLVNSGNWSNSSNPSSPGNPGTKGATFWAGTRDCSGDALELGCRRGVAVVCCGVDADADAAKSFSSDAAGSSSTTPE